MALRQSGIGAWRSFRVRRQAITITRQFRKMNSKQRQQAKHEIGRGIAPPHIAMAQRRSTEPQPPAKQWRGVAAGNGAVPENARADEVTAHFYEALRRHRDGQQGEAIALYKGI